MVICFKCSTEIKTILDDLYNAGQYRDYSEIISVALTNLALLQEELSTGEGAIVIGPESDGTLQDSAITAAKQEAARARVSSLGKGFTNRDTESNGASVEAHLPELFSATNLDEPPFPLADVPVEDQDDEREIPPQRWLWGQYNKLLPAKASCRALAHLLEDSPAGILLETAALSISEQAAILGDFLMRHDEQNNLKRGEALSTAFPRTGTDAGKGRLRYANQFVGSVNKQGCLSGLLADLKLIDSASAEDVLPSLTGAGWRFAALQNPVLDSLQENPAQKFAEEEKEFLLDHIASSVPVENSAYRTILEAVGNSADTPNRLDSYLGERFSIKSSRGTESSSYLSTQRSGAISRMADLGLVARRRNGTRISYVVTDRGNQYAKRPVTEKGE